MCAWAEKHYYLVAETAEVRRFRPWPFQREILRALGDDQIPIVVWMKSARVGYTKCLGAAVAYYMTESPRNQMMVQPTIKDAVDWVRDEMNPMLRDIPRMRGVSPDGPRSGNTLQRKQYRGCVLRAVGANSPGGFRRVAAQNVWFDEVDGYPPAAGAEGDQIGLGMRRTDTFRHRKIAIGSTPTMRGASKVEEWYERSDKRRYHVPCLACGKMTWLRWADLRWPDDEPEKAAWYCPSCGAEAQHRQKWEMIENGKWIAEQPFDGIAGFHVSALYSYAPNSTWSDLAKEFLAAREKSKAGDHLSMTVVVNTIFGETWQEEGEKMEWEYLYVRREDYETEDEVPDGVLLITAGGDVQGDRIEVQIIGWGSGEESWVIDHVVLAGNPGEQAVWKQLDQLLDRRWKSAIGELSIASLAIDAGGQHTQAVYDWTGPRASRRVFACRGATQVGRPLISELTRLKKGRKYEARVLPIGTEAAKDLLFARLAIEQDGPGRIHFPNSLQQGYFRQLTAEHALTIYSRGKATRRWVMRPGCKRNEALDTMVYALGAMRNLSVAWKVLEGRRKDVAEEPEETERPDPVPARKWMRPGQPRQRPRPPGKSGWMQGWR